MTAMVSSIPVISVLSSLTKAVVLRYYFPTLLATFFAIILLPISSAADEVQTLAPVVVVGTLDPPSSSPPSLEEAVIRQLPVGNGTLSELLRLLPGLQLSEDYNSAKTGGEILPPTISISGGKVYQNNFLVDGLANNNLIDPAKGATDLVTDAPGHPQERFLDSDLIESVTVYDRNVPARFGLFAGGVVEATTRNHGSEMEGKLRYRTTRNQWTKFHLSGADQSDFAAGGGSQLQPKFTKNDYGASLAFPLTPRSGILTSWRWFDSRIPLPYFLGTKSETRRQQSYFIKYVSEFSSADSLEISLSSTPYREERFLRNVQDSDYVIKMEGLAAQGLWKHPFSRGEVEVQSAYRRSTNLRSAPQHFRNWAATDSKAWGRLVGSEFSVEGGFGTVEKIQESFDLKSTLHLEPIISGKISHALTSGIELNRTLGSFERKETTYVYQGARLSADIQCGLNDFDCVDQEQFFTTRTRYDAGISRATMNQIAWHGEDLLRYRRLELRPGLRLDYNDLMENVDLAPRFVASYDLFGRGETVLTAGANRYYGTTLLTDKLREAKTPFRIESRSSYNNQPTPWEESSAQGPNVTRFTSLQTPYADELSVGVAQKIYGGLLDLSYLRREGRNEFARTYSPLQPNGLHYYTLNNFGKSHHQRYSLGWQRTWARHFLSLNASWQETTTTNDGYDSVLESEEISSQIWYENQLIAKGDLPARTQNRPVIVNLIWIAELPAHVTFTNLSRYRSGYREIVATGDYRPLPDAVSRIDPVTGEEILDAVEVYEEINHRGKVIFDWKLGWSRRVYHQQLLAFTLEINNVFNSRTQTGGTTTTYEIGRQFWAGIAYDF